MKIYKLLFSLILTVFAFACTNRFDEINVDPQVVTPDEASAKWFLTTTQADLYGPGRYAYWRAQLIHADRYAGQFTFGSAGSWWSDELGYTYNGSYTDATWDWLENYYTGLDAYLLFTNVGGSLENDKMYAVGLIMKSLYYQLYTDTFGEIPYANTGVDEGTLPKFDTQHDIYAGIISDLDNAIAIIGDATNTSDFPGDINDLGKNDLFFGGDLQMWSKLANSLKLRIAMRARGASGDDFSSQAITSALAGNLLGEGENALMQKDLVIDQFESGSYGDIWHNFGGFGSKWNVSQDVIHYLRDFGNDPRLEVYAAPALGGDFNFTKGDDETAFNKRLAVITSELDAAGAVYSITDNGDNIDMSVEGGYYAGQPVRLGSDIKALARQEFFSYPADIVINPKGGGAEEFPEVVFSAAEVYFLRAEAAVVGASGENAQTMFETGIRQAMALWEVDGENYIATSPLADITTGTVDEKLEKIAIQRWLAAYTDGFEAWSVVRDSGYPASLAAGVSDADIYGLGSINGDYPQRMRYGNSAYNKNGDNLAEAISRQGPDAQNTKLWWAK